MPTSKEWFHDPKYWYEDPLYADGSTLPDFFLIIQEAQRLERERCDRIVRETMDASEHMTNAEFIACDDLTSKVLSRLNPPEKEQ